MAPGKPSKTNIFIGKGKTTTEKDRPTKTIGKLKDEHEKEAVLVIWRYKNIPSCGHAALKLKKLDITDDKVKRFDYISWWPSSDGYIDTDKLRKIQKNKLISPLRDFQPRDGGGHENYWTDEDHEMGDDKRIAIFLSYFYQACYQDNLIKVKSDLEYWWYQNPLYHKDWRDMGFEECFRNMESMISQGRIGLGRRQKVMKDSKFAAPGKREFDLKKIHDAFGNGNLLNATIYSRAIGKLPDVKIYLPCAHLKRIVTPDIVPPVQFQFVWGLSLDAIRLSWRIFKDNPNPQWQMITNKTNCSSVVWNRLMDGYADALLEGNTGDLIAALQREIFIQPNNITTLGERLEKALERLNTQQRKIDAAIQKYYPKIRELAMSDKLALQEKDNWPSMLKSVFWQDISKTKNIRPPSLRKIDDEVKIFEKKSNEIKRDEERRIIKAIMQDEKRYDDFNNELDRAEKAKAPAFRVKSLKDKIEATRGMMSINFKMITKHRNEKAKHLVKLHNSIYTYVESAKNDDERLPSVLLLGQCVACAFFETMHHGVSITLQPQPQMFIPVINEEDVDYKEAVMSPTVDLRILGS